MNNLKTYLKQYSTAMYKSYTNDFTNWSHTL